MDSSQLTEMASKIFEAELELDSNPSMQALNNLAILYRHSIEHLESIHSPKVHDYQERLQKTLMRPAILQLMQENSKLHKKSPKKRSQAANPSSSTTPPSILAPIVKPHTKGELPEGPNDSPPAPDSPKNEKLANRIVETQQKRTATVTHKAVSELKAQDLSLKSRLAGRKQRGLSMILDSSFVNKLTAHEESVAESEKSAGVNGMETMLQRIERIMEESFCERSEKVTEIRVKYGTEIGELEKEGGVYMEVVKEMKRRMEKEIEAVCLMIDLKRKEMIGEMKKELGVEGVKG